MQNIRNIQNLHSHVNEVYKLHFIYKVEHIWKKGNIDLGEQMRNVLQNMLNWKKQGIKYHL